MNDPLEKINAAIQETQMGSAPSATAELAFAMSILNSQIINYSIRIANVRRIVEEIEGKFLSTKPHMTIEEASRHDMEKTIKEKNSILTNLAKKLAFNMMDAYLPGVIPVSRFYKDGIFSRLVMNILDYFFFLMT